MQLGQEEGENPNIGKVEILKTWDSIAIKWESYILVPMFVSVIMDVHMHVHIAQTLRSHIIKEKLLFQNQQKYQ